MEDVFWDRFHDMCPKLGMQLSNEHLRAAMLSLFNKGHKKQI